MPTMGKFETMALAPGNAESLSLVVQSKFLAKNHRIMKLNWNLVSIYHYT